MNDKPRESYYVTIRSAANDSRRQERFSANNFAEAEQKAYDHVHFSSDEEIISIERGLQGMTQMFDIKDKIEAFRLLSIKGRLQLELKGMRFRVNTFPVVKKEFGFKGNNQKVYDQYIAMLKERGILEKEG